MDEFKTISVQGCLTTSENFLNEVISNINQEVDFCGTRTGLVKYDYITGGLKKATLNFVAARTSVGKSNFLLNCTRKLMTANKKVMYIDLESQGELNNLRLCSMAMRRNLLKELQMHRPGTENYLAVKRLIELAKKELKPNNLIYISKSGLTVTQIQEYAEDLEIDLLIIDHIQKVKSDNSANRYERYANIAEDLRILADNLENIPLLIAAQLNRSAEGDNKPTAAQLKGAGELEEGADTLTMLTICTDKEGNPINELSFDVVKNRHGFTGSGKLLYDRDICLIDNL